MNDVIVIGAGPAGNSAARHLAQLGYDVTVIDRGERIGDKLCTGIVGRECVRRYPADESLIYRDARSARFIAPSGEELELVREESQAFVLNRVGYVASFAQEAKKAGASYLLGERVTDLSFADDHVQVCLAPQSPPRTLMTKAVVVASGFGTPLTNGLGMGTMGDYVTGIQAEVMAPGVDQVHAYFGREVAPGFFAWLVPTHGEQALVGLLARRHAHLCMESFMERLMREGTVASVIKEPRQWGIPLKHLSRTFGERVVVVGDAAGQVKPTTGGGIYYSLLAGELAAETLHQGFVQKNLSASRLSHYENRWKKLMGREMEVGSSARRMFEVLGDSQMDRIMRTVKERELHIEILASPELSFDWHSRFILRALTHPVFGSFIRHLSPMLAALLFRIKGR